MSTTVGASPIDLNQSAFEPLQLFLAKEKIPSEQWPTFHEITPKELPAPFDYLLTQPLLTKALTEHYHAVPIIEPPLQIEDDPAHQRYYRAVLLTVDQVVVELGLITMNTAALPVQLMNDVRESNEPFGALLMREGIHVSSVDERILKTTCNPSLARYTACKEGTVMYGRRKTLVRNDNKMWVAHVLEMLTGV